MPKIYGMVESFGGLEEDWLHIAIGKHLVRSNVQVQTLCEFHIEIHLFVARREIGSYMHMERI